MTRLADGWTPTEIAKETRTSTYYISTIVAELANELEHESDQPFSDTAPETPV